MPQARPRVLRLIRRSQRNGNNQVPTTLALLSSLHNMASPGGRQEWTPTCLGQGGGKSSRQHGKESGWGQGCCLGPTAAFWETIYTTLMAWQSSQRSGLSPRGLKLHYEALLCYFLSYSSFLIYKIWHYNITPSRVEITRAMFAKFPLWSGQ